MTWIDNTGEVRPDSWEEYCELKRESCDYDEWDRFISLHGPMREPSPSPRPVSDRHVPPIRQRLHRASPFCFWCGVRVELEIDCRTENFATVDHLYSRFHPERESKHKQQKDVLHVLACRVCNQERASAEERQQPFIPKLKEKISFAQRACATRARKVSETRYPVRPQMRALQTLKEAIEFARSNPGR